MNDSGKFWETERIAIAPETAEEWEPMWSVIGAEFRSRSGNREGSIYTNHQGLVAIRAMSRMITEKSTTLPELQEDDFRDIDGITLSRRLAFLVGNELMGIDPEGLLIRIVDRRKNRCPSPGNGRI
jgi:hypothetical protein